MSNMVYFTLLKIQPAVRHPQQNMFNKLKLNSAFKKNERKGKTVTFSHEWCHNKSATTRCSGPTSTENQWPWELTLLSEHHVFLHLAKDPGFGKSEMSASGNTRLVLHKLHAVYDMFEIWSMREGLASVPNGFETVEKWKKKKNSELQQLCVTPWTM